jgi:hypothetical protein
VCSGSRQLNVPILFSPQSPGHISLRRFCFIGARGSIVAAPRFRGHAHYQRYSRCQGQPDEACQRDVRRCLWLLHFYSLATPEGSLQIKFIKFFAWEEQWIKKIIDARKVELDWLRKGAAALLSHLT